MGAGNVDQGVGHVMVRPSRVTGEAGVDLRECPGFAGLRPDGQMGCRSLTQDGETRGVFRREVLQRPRKGGTLNSNEEGVHDAEGSFTGRERRASAEGQR